MPGGQSRVDRGLVLLACMLTAAISTGIMFSLGSIFLDVVTTFNTSRTLAALVQSLCVGVGLGAGVVTGPVLGMLGGPLTLTVGSLLVCAGFVGGSLAPDIYVLIACFGALIGPGFSCLYLTCQVVAGNTFHRLRHLALTLVSSFGGVAQSLYPALFRWLVERYTLRGTMLIFAGLGLHGVLFAAVIRVFGATHVRKEGPREDDGGDGGCVGGPETYGGGQGAEEEAGPEECRDGQEKYRHGQDTEMNHGYDPNGERRKEQGGEEVDRRRRQRREMQQQKHGEGQGKLGPEGGYVNEGFVGEQAEMHQSSDFGQHVHCNYDRNEKGADLKPKGKLCCDSQTNLDTVRFVTDRIADTEVPAVSHTAFPSNTVPNVSNGEAPTERGVVAMGHSGLNHRTMDMDDTASTSNQREQSQTPTKCTHEQQISVTTVSERVEMFRAETAVETQVQQKNLSEQRTVKTPWPGFLRFLHLDLFHNTPYVTVMLTCASCFLTFNTPGMFMVDMATSRGLAVDQGTTLLSVLLVTNTVSRAAVGPLLMAFPHSALTLLATAMAGFGLSILALPLLANKDPDYMFAGHVAVCALSGCFYGAVVSLRLMTTLSLVDVMTQSAAALGYGYFIDGLSTSIGGPLGGWLRDATGSYDYMFFLATGQALLATIVLAIVKGCCLHNSPANHKQATEYVISDVVSDAYSDDGIVEEQSIVTRL